MSNTVSAENRRKQVVVMLTPEAFEYVEGKAPMFVRGKRGGFSEALNRMVIFCKEYEAVLGKGGGN